MKTVVKMTALAAALSISTIANSAIISKWSYTNEAGFASSSDRAGNSVTQLNRQTGVNRVAEAGTPSTTLSVDTYKRLEWGSPVDGVNRSSLEIDSPISGSINTANINDSLVFSQGTDIIHNNFGISGNSENWLASAVVVDGLSLSASELDLSGVDISQVVDEAALANQLLSSVRASAPELTFSFDFLETPNRPRSGVCADGNDANANGFGCLDYFVFQPIPGLPLTVSDNNTVNDTTDDFIEFRVQFDLLNGGFPEELAQSLNLVTEYEVITRLSGLTILETDRASICGDQEACVGFATQERSTNRLRAEFAVRAVSAPTVISLLALSVGAMFVRRRKKSS